MDYNEFQKIGKGLRMRLGRIFYTVDSWGLFFARLALGTIFLAHGAQKLFGWFGGSGFELTMANFHDGLGIPSSLAFLAIITEFFGALAILLGFLTRLAALGLSCIMVVAIYLIHLPNGFFLNWYCAQGQGHGIEFNLALLGMTLALLVSGPGNASVDKWLSEI